MRTKFIDAVGAPYTPRRYLGFKDVQMLPKVSDVIPSEVDISTTLWGKRLPSPFLYDFGDIDFFDVEKYRGRCVLYPLDNVDSAKAIADIEKLSAVCAYVFLQSRTSLDNLLEVLVFDKKLPNLAVFYEPPKAEYHLFDNYEIIQRGRNTKLKFKNLPVVISGVSQPQMAAAAMNAGLDGIRLAFCFEVAELTKTLQIVSTIAAAQINFTIFLEAYHNPIFSIASGVDILITGPYLNSQDEDLHTGMVQYGVRNLQEAFDDLIFYEVA